MLAHRSAFALLAAPAIALVLALGCGDAGESGSPEIDGQAGDAATGGRGGEPTASGGGGGESSTGGDGAASGGQGGDTSSGGFGEAGGTQASGGHNGSGGGADYLEVSCEHPYSTYCKVFAGPVERVVQASQWCSTYEYVGVDACPTAGVTGVCEMVDGDLSLRDIYYFDDEQDLANAEENCIEGLGIWSDTL